MVDVGTGSGAVALALKDERPDLTCRHRRLAADALDVARANAERLGLDVELLDGDLLEPVAGPLTPCSPTRPTCADGDRASSRPTSRATSRALALFAGADGLDADPRAWCRRAATGARCSRSRSAPARRDAVAEIVRAAGFGETRGRRDLAGIERVVVGRR